MEQESQRLAEAQAELMNSLRGPVIENTKVPSGARGAYDLPLLRNLLAQSPVDEELFRQEWEAQVAYAERRYDLVVFKILLSILNNSGLFLSPATRAVGYRYQGIYYLLKCEYSEAEKYLNTAETFARQSAPDQLPFILSDLGYILLQLGKHEKASQVLLTGLQLANISGNPDSLAVIYDNLATLAYSKGDLEGLINDAQRTLDYAQKAGNGKIEGSALNSIATYYLHHREWDKAFEYFNKSIEIKQACGDLMGQGEIRSNMGAAARYKGDLQEALFQNEYAITICEQIRYKTGLANALDNQAHVLNLLKRSDEALGCAQRALELRRDAGDSRGEVVSLTKLAMVYRSLGDNTRALQHLEAARGLAEMMDERILLMKIYIDLGEMRLASCQGDSLNSQHSQALDYFRRAIELMVQMGDRTLLPTSSLRVAEAALKCGCNTCADEALLAYQRLLDLLTEQEQKGQAQPSELVAQRTNLFYGLAKSYQLKRRAGIAFEYYQQAVQLVETLPEDATGTLDVGMLYCQAAQSATDSGYFNEAFNWLETGLSKLREGQEKFSGLKATLAARQPTRKRQSGPLNFPG